MRSQWRQGLLWLLRANRLQTSGSAGPGDVERSGREVSLRSSHTLAGPAIDAPCNRRRINRSCAGGHGVRGECAAAAACCEPSSSSNNKGQHSTREDGGSTQRGIQCSSTAGRTLPQRWRTGHGKPQYRRGLINGQLGLCCARWSDTATTSVAGLSALRPVWIRGEGWAELEGWKVKAIVAARG